MQTNVEIRTESTPILHPQALLQNLLTSLSSPCNCAQSADHEQAGEHHLNEEIKISQVEISNIHAEVL